MAAKLPTGQGRPTPASNIYTLPVSCQICLGKVRQPVLCSNFHVFCHTCIDTWLKRSNRCPSCRVLIDHTNPVKQIRGGLGQKDEEDQEKSTPELRKTRFDLLYRDYEDTLEQLDREVKRLRCENARLKSQLSPDQITDGSSGTGGKGMGNNELQLLTGKLQDAQKLYDRVKQDISKVKKENHSLKEANANLTHENTKLREEISNRSPQKFGRLTVATLEAQLKSLKKENLRLTGALERSDRYIESLQHQLDQAGAASARPENTGSNSISNSIRGFPLHVLASGSSSSSAREPDSGSRLSVKRQLFPAELGPGSDLSSVDSKGQSRSTTDGENRLSDCSSSPTFGKTFDSKSRDVLDSIMRRSDTAPTVDVKKEKSPVKKVHFSVTEKKSNDSSSFNLEVPSPIVPSSDYSLDKFPTRHQDNEVSKPVHRSGHSPPSSDWVEPSHKENDLSSRRASSSYTSSVKADPLSSMLRQKYDGRKETGEPGSNSNLSEPEFTTPQSLDELDSGKFRPSTKKVNFSKDAKDKRKSKSNAQGGNFSFNLDEPSLDDTQTIQTELKDLDISMTPELSDCLKLLNRAERKVSHVESPTAPAGTVSAGNIGSVTTCSTALLPAGKHYMSVPDRAPNLFSEADRMNLGKGSVNIGVERTSGYPSSSGFLGSSGVPGTYVPGTTGVMSSWEHGFFSSLRVNPFKHAAPPTHIASSSQNIAGVPDEFKSLTGLPRMDQSSWASSLPARSQGSALTDMRGSEFPVGSAASSSTKVPEPSAYTRMTRSSSLDRLPSSTANHSAAVGFTRSGSPLSLEHPPSVMNFLSDGVRSSQPVTCLTSSVYPLNIASSSGFGQQASHMRDVHSYSNSACLSEQPERLTLSSVPASGTSLGGYMSRDRKTPNNYSYVSNASSQGIDNTDSNHLDSFLPEPKKRLFALDSEEESDFGSPRSKTTKIL